MCRTFSDSLACRRCGGIGEIAAEQYTSTNTHPPTHPPTSMDSNEMLLAQLIAEQAKKTMVQSSKPKSSSSSASKDGTKRKQQQPGLSLATAATTKRVKASPPPSAVPDEMIPGNRRMQLNIADDDDARNEMNNRESIDELNALLTDIIAPPPPTISDTSVTAEADGSSSSMDNKKSNKMMMGGPESSSSAASSTVAATQGGRRQQDGTFFAKVGEIETLIRVLEFLKNFYGLTLIFEPEGLCSIGCNDEWSYVYEAFLHKSFFEEYTSSGVIEMAANVDVICKTIKDLKKFYRPKSLVLEKKADDLLIRDCNNINERRVISTPEVNSDLPPVLADRIRKLQFNHHVTVPALNFCKTLDRVISSDIQRVQLSYYENSHLLISWDEEHVRNPRCRFPILQSTSSSSSATEAANSSNHKNLPIIEAQQKPIYQQTFNRRFISMVSRANRNCYVQFAFPAIPDDPSISAADSSSLPILIKMKIYQKDTNPKSTESYIRMWIAPCV